MSQPANSAITRYQNELRQALKLAPPSEREEALRDATEYLSNELVEQAELSDEQLYEHFVDSYGSPQQVAREYLPDSIGGAHPGHATNHLGLLAAGLFVLLAVGGMFLFDRQSSRLLPNLTGNSQDQEPPKISPFTKVDFRENQIMVEFKGQTYEWLAIDEIPVVEIVASSKKQFGDRWQKRIAEDLVEVFWGMDHYPEETVQLRLRDPDNGAKAISVSATMTHENRRAVYKHRYREPPKVSPFTKLEFEDEQIVVEYEGKSYQWLAIDDIEVAKVVASSKEQFGALWQKRIVEDLVELLGAWATTRKTPSNSNCGT